MWLIPSRDHMFRSKITFSTQFELYASANGIQELACGSSPYNPDVVSAVRRNCEMAMAITEDDNELICEAAKFGERSLIEQLEKIFVPVGRATEGRWQ